VECLELTKEDGEKWRLVQQPRQHSLVDRLDFVGQFAIVVVYQPLQDRLFVLEVALEQERVAVAEVDQRGERLDAVSLGQLGVLDADQVDPVDVTLVVDLLQVFENLLADVTVLLVEVDGQVLRVLDQILQHDSSDELDAVFGALLDQPLQHLLLFFEVPFEHAPHSFFEVHQDGKVCSAVVLGDFEVLRFDEDDAVALAVVVDVLQFFEDVGALLALVAI
jgi:hypothetical protein